MEEPRFATRSLARRPGYAGVAIGTLALGIGASVAIFAVASSVLLRARPYPDSNRIVVVEHHAPGLGLPQLGRSDGTALQKDEPQTPRHAALRAIAEGGPTGRIVARFTSPSCPPGQDTAL